MKIGHLIYLKKREVDEYRFSQSKIMTVSLKKKNHRKYSNISDKESDILNVINYFRYYEDEDEDEE